jgi:hypothetical protein
MVVNHTPSVIHNTYASGAMPSSEVKKEKIN